MPPEVIAGEPWVSEHIATLLAERPELALICKVLNTVDQDGATLDELMDRPLQEIRRIVGLATAVLNQLDPEIVTDAIEDVAHLLCEGKIGEYSTFESQTPHVQKYYRELAQSAFNRIQTALERQP